MLTWSEEFILGDDAIDHDHREAVEMMNRIETADDGGVPALFAALVEHMHEHFARENALMLETHFPAHACHAGEHERVLTLLDGIAAEVAAGRLASARDFAAAAGPAWFVDHRNTMDFVTVGWARARSAH